MRHNSKYISVKVSQPHLRERNEELFILLDISNFLSMSHSLEEVLHGALSKVLEYFSFNAGRIYLLDESGEFLSLAACQGVEAEGLEKLHIGEGFSGRAARTRSFISQHTSDLDDRKRAALLLGKGFVMITCVPLVAMGQVLGVMNLAADKEIELDESKIDLLISIGNLIAIAANNARLYADLDSKINELKVQKNAIEFFAYSISHDLKSPAVAIHGLTRRLYKQYGPSPAEKEKLYFDQILKASEQIVRLVDHINVYIRAKEAPLYFEEVQVKEILQTIRDEFSEALTGRGVTWTEPDDIPPMVADKISLIRIFRNLVDNALRYGGSELREITVGYAGDAEYHVLSVGDDGVTLTPQDAEKLFEIFHRHESSKGVEGTGLGLAIVKEIAERHKGRVWLDPDVKKGTRFCISISRHLQQQSAERCPCSSNSLHPH